MRIGIFKGEFQYGAVNVFADDLAEACARHNVEPALIDLRRPHAEYAALVEALETAPDTLGFVAFNGVGLADRAALGLPARRTKSALAWLVDHPLEHLVRVVELKDDIIATIDSGHAQFLKGLGLKSVVCLPHAGAVTPAARPWGERSIRLLLPGTIADPAGMQAASRAEIEASLGPDWAKLYDDLTQDPKIAFDDQLIERAQRARKRAGDANTMSPPLCIVMTHAIRARRNARRLAVVQALDEAGVALTLAGKGWDAFAFTNHQTLGPKPFAETRALFADARFVLHVNPLFGAGLHERVTYAALAGAIVVSDTNALLKRTLAGGRGVIFDDAAELADRLTELEQTGAGALMAAAGQERMRTDHSWDARARTLIETLQTKARLARVA